jgi:hypothetical protein
MDVKRGEVVLRQIELYPRQKIRMADAEPRSVDSVLLGRFNYAKRRSCDFKCVVRFCASSGNNP